MNLWVKFAHPYPGQVLYRAKQCFVSVCHLRLGYYSRWCSQTYPLLSLVHSGRTVGTSSEVNSLDSLGSEVAADQCQQVALWTYLKN